MADTPEINFRSRTVSENGKTFGYVVISFKGLTEMESVHFIESAAYFVEGRRKKVSVSEKVDAPTENIVSVDKSTITIPEVKGTNTIAEQPKKKISKRGTFSPSPRLMGYHHVFIKGHKTLEDLSRAFYEKYPNHTHVASNLLTEIWRRHHPEVKVIPDVVPPMGAPAEMVRFKPGDRVIQVSGIAPVPGTGVVQSRRDDGIVTVKFLSNTRVLHEECFALAPPKDDERGQ